MAKVNTGGRGGLEWRNFKVLERNISNFRPKVDVLIAGSVERKGLQKLGEAKVNAPWTDRTGNARGGLGVEFSHVPGVMHGFALYYSVPYGIWLEVRWSGKYATITRTLSRSVMHHLIAEIRAGIAALR